MKQKKKKEKNARSKKSMHIKMHIKVIDINLFDSSIYNNLIESNSNLFTVIAS